MTSCSYSTDCHDCVSYKDTLLDVRNVSLSYGDKQILRDVNVQVLDVERKCHVQGQVVGFLGPSGVGKTQLFRIIAGLQQPTSGGVFINSTHDPVKAGMVGVVSQSYTLFEHRTVLGNMILGAMKKEPSRKAAIEKSMELLNRFELTDKAHYYPALLSGGQRQRVAICQQLLSSEHFLLMDEPFSGLDLVALEKVSKLITDVACLDTLNTIILITHDVSAAAAVSDHLLMIGRDRDPEGKIIPGARIQEVYDLVSMGLCWQENILTRPDFLNFVATVKERFRSL